MPETITCPLAAQCLDEAPRYRDEGHEFFCPVALVLLMHGHALEYPTVPGVDVVQLAKQLEEYYLKCLKTGELL